VQPTRTATISKGRWWEVGLSLSKAQGGSREYGYCNRTRNICGESHCELSPAREGPRGSAGRSGSGEQRPQSSKGNLKHWAGYPGETSLRRKKSDQGQEAEGIIIRLTTAGRRREPNQRFSVAGGETSVERCGREERRQKAERMGGGWIEASLARGGVARCHRVKVRSSEGAEIRVHRVALSEKRNIERSYELCGRANCSAYSGFTMRAKGGVVETPDLTGRTRPRIGTSRPRKLISRMLEMSHALFNGIKTKYHDSQKDQLPASGGLPPCVGKGMMPDTPMWACVRTYVGKGGKGLG